MAARKKSNIIAMVVHATVTWLITAWQLMLGIGVAHIHWWHQVPTVGFTTSLVITFLFWSMLSGGTTMVWAIHKGWM